MAELPKNTNPTVLHVITSLDTGGAEMMIIKLLETLQPWLNSCVIVLMDRGTLAPRLEALGVPVRYLGLPKGAIPGIHTIRQLLRLAREFNPSVIQGWMYHGNLAAWLVAKILRPQPTLIWNIRQTLYQLDTERRTTGWIIKIGALLSRAPLSIIYNSALSALQHEAVGYSQSKRIVIPNGFDLKLFKPDAQQREFVRQELSIPPTVRLIGHVARYHPMKDHNNLLKAARVIVDSQNDVRFVLIGRQVDRNNAAIEDQIKNLGLEQHVILLGERPDIPRIMTAFDLVVSSSAWGEGFPNVIGEAMATGVPCVVTDVGDSAYVIGNSGLIVPPGNHYALARAIVEMLALDSELLAKGSGAARDRVSNLFSIDQVGLSYLNLYLEAAKVKCVV